MFDTIIKGISAKENFVFGLSSHLNSIALTTVKTVCKDHLFNKINYLWFIQ